MHHATFEQVERDAAAVLSRFLSGAPSRALRDQMQGAINDFYNRQERDGNTCFVSEWGLCITGFRITGIEGDRVAGRWKTAWPYFARFAQPHTPGVILGTHGPYDLYLCEQGLLPATLLARYGNDGAYSTFNPKLQGMRALAGAPEIFAIAWARACALGYADLVSD
ncbi:hypothetical protein [Paraburkholderia sp. MM6662-R1]|uniref:hypothetical protein n=1 Tax=Paraburkholderia sp. MM6662-R1 TaxID=2991066 RepID=UPI003D200BFC